MHALVTTISGLFLVDLESGQHVQLHVGSHLYFGITWDHELLYVGCSQDSHACVLKVNRFLEPTSIDRLKFRNGNPHSMFFDPDSDQVYWTMSGFDSMLVSDDFKKWDKWVLTDEDPKEFFDKTGRAAPFSNFHVIRNKVIYEDHERWRGPGTANLHHFNGVFINQERIVVSAHNRGGTSELYVYTKGRTPFYTRAGGNNMHTPWIEDGVIHFISSGTRQVMTETGDALHTFDEPCFPRAVLKGQGLQAIGLSAVSSREQRHRGTSHIVIFDENWNEARRITLPSGQIYEMRLLASDPATHNGLEPPIHFKAIEEKLSHGCYEHRP